MPTVAGTATTASAVTATAADHAADRIPGRRAADRHTIGHSQQARATSPSTTGVSGHTTRSSLSAGAAWPAQGALTQVTGYRSPARASGVTARPATPSTAAPPAATYPARLRTAGPA